MLPTVPQPDPTPSAWLVFLPPLKGLNVLKLGSHREENLRALARRGAGEISCLTEVPPARNEDGVRYVRSWREVAPGRTDLIVVDEFPSLSSSDSPSALHDALVQCHNLLREGGQLLLCLPDGLRNLRLRWILPRLLKAAGFSRLDSFFCHASSDYPAIMIASGPNTAWAARWLASMPDAQPRGVRVKGRILSKRILFSALRFRNPFLGIVLIAQKPAAKTSPEDLSFAARLQAIGSAEQGSNTRLVVVANSSLLGGRQLLRLYDASQDHIVAAGKLADAASGAGLRTRRECENLQALSTIASQLKQRKIGVPEVRFSEFSSQTAAFITNAAGGESLEFALGPLLAKNRRGEVARWLESAAGVLRGLHEALDPALRDRAAALDPRYFENPWGIHFASLPLPEPAALSRGTVQHGDFVVVNLLCSQGSDEWSVLDWEDLAVGYPPLFDLFALLRSVKFTKRQEKHPARAEEVFAAFVDTFFQRNWFSAIVREMVQAAAAGLTSEQSVEALLQFLLVMANRYRIVSPSSFMVEAYSRMLTYAHEHRTQCVLGPTG